MSHSDYRPPPSETLYLADLQSGTTQEEVKAAFEHLPGYIETRVRLDKSGGTVAFVQFQNSEASSAAREALDGLLRIRPTEPPVSIHFARPSLSGGAPDVGSKRGRDAGPQSAPQPPPAQRSRDTSYGSSAPSRFSDSAPPSQYQSQPPSHHRGFDDGPAPGFARGPLAALGGLSSNAITAQTGSYSGGGGYNGGSERATLYVEGVPIDATEREMSHVFRPFVGYRDLRFVVRRDRNPLCFVEFETADNAATAMAALQHYVVNLKDPRDKGIRIEHAKSVLRDHGSSSGSSGAPAAAQYSGGRSTTQQLPSQSLQHQQQPMPSSLLQPQSSYSSVGSAQPMGGYSDRQGGSYISAPQSNFNGSSHLYGADAHALQQQQQLALAMASQMMPHGYGTAPGGSGGYSQQQQLSQRQR